MKLYVQLDTALGPLCSGDFRSGKFLLFLGISNKTEPCDCLVDGN